MIGHNHIGRNGRFGNQMFQYAATKGIAANRGYEYCIPPGPKDEYEFEDEENQHKLFMAFKLSGLKSTQVFPAEYRKESGFNFDKDNTLIMLCGDPKIIGAPIKKGGWKYIYPNYGLINIFNDK